MKRSRIVLIEDNSADVLLVELALKENDICYELIRFRNGQEAVDSLCAVGPTVMDAFLPDAILVDLNTPQSDGFHVLGRIIQNPHLSGVPIAVITSSQARSDRHRTSLMGIVRYIEKPSQLEEFLSTIGRAVKEMLHA